MELSIFLAKFWGLFFVISSAALLINSKTIKTIFDLTKDIGFVITSGYISLIIGILLVVAHNVWEPNWRGLITILGWLALFKGFVRVAYPEKLQKIAKPFSNKILINTILILMLLTGIFLLYCGFLLN